MDTSEQTAHLFFEQISGVLQAAGKTEAEQRFASKALVDAAVTFLPPEKDHLVVAELLNGELTQVVHFNPVAAIGLLANLVGGMIGAESAVALACAVVGCLASLKELRDSVPRAQGVLLLAVYESTNHIASRKQAERRFNELCELDDRVRAEDFESALQGLLTLGCIKETTSGLQVVDHVLVR
jgi:hypothetical protein